MEDQSQMGLISPDDPTPLSQFLISPELASAFGITQEDLFPVFDLNQEMRASCSTICLNERLYYPYDSRVGVVDLSSDEDMDDEGKKRAAKKHRLAWTMELHNRFAESIKHLGDKVVPKTILQHMNVEGITRENVASHLQKYRSYLKKMEKEKVKKSDEGCSKDPSEVKSIGMEVMEHSNVHPCPSHEHGHGQSQQHSVQYGSVPLMVPPLGFYGYGHGYGHMRMPMSMTMPMPMPMPPMPMVFPPPPPGYYEFEPGACSMVRNKPGG